MLKYCYYNIQTKFKVFLCIIFKINTHTIFICFQERLKKAFFFLSDLKKFDKKVDFTLEILYNYICNKTFCGIVFYCTSLLNIFIYFISRQLLENYKLKIVFLTNFLVLFQIQILTFLKWTLRTLERL